MHIDIREVEPGTTIEGDICIVGAGPAGLSIALEFDHTATRVILLEGGGFEYDDQVQELYAGRTTGQQYFPLKSTRLHYFGGATGHWGGQCSPLEAIDFERREWMDHSGWPLQRSELDEFYPRAHQFLDLGKFDYDVANWQAGRPAFAELLPPNAAVWSKLWRFVPLDQLHLGPKLRPAIVASKNIALYTYANATKVMANETLTQVDGISVTNHAGRQHVIKARRYILACCTIQNARLLLASNDRAAAGLGNENDLVGRFFMEHVEMNAGELWLDEPGRLKLYEYEYGKTVARAELAISAEKQREHGILNGTMSLLPLAMSRENKPKMELWSNSDPRKAHFRMAAEHRGFYDRLKKFIRVNGPIEPRAYQLCSRMEQAPNPNSRVTLDTERDALGVPRAHLNWEFTHLEKHSLRQICKIIGRQVGMAGVGRVRLLDYLQDENDESWPSFTAAGMHHMGTTRMSEDPRQGVVNRNCRLHQMENLYVAGASCFPTAGAVNPTLSLVALCLRLADHLKQQQAHA